MSVHAGRTVLAGRYRLDEVIGRGGMSTVYRATDHVLGRTVAVKVLLPALADQDATYAARFEREAQAAAALQDREVVTVYDTGIDDGSHYIVMEYISGRSLEQILRGGVRLDVAEAARIAAAVAGALACAHAAGILHRDIKPANVMVADDGAVKVLDFGIARRLDGTAITQVASVLGTASYMAPERALGKPGDARADTYSLGCLLYAMLTGGPPFSGEVSAAVLHQQINADPRPPSTFRDGISPALDAMVLAMLAKAPEERPASISNLRDALLRSAGAATPLTAPTQAMPRRPSTAGGLRLPSDHRRRAVVMALITALITLIAVALLSGGGSSRHGPAHSGAVTTRSRTTKPPRSSTPVPPTATQPKPKNPKPELPKPKQPNSGGPPAPAGAPPGHGGEPPGQAKKHGPGGPGH